MPKVKRLVLAGLLLAVKIVLGRFLPIRTPFLSISFAFMPNILAGWMLGPLWNGIIGVLGDVLGVLLFPQGAYFPGFTFNALLAGLAYGFMLYDRPVNKKLFVRLVIAIVFVTMVVNVGLNTLWLSVISKRAFMVLIPPRILKNLIMIPIELTSGFLLMRFMEKPVNRYLRERPREGGEYGEDGGIASDDTVQ